MLDKWFASGAEGRLFYNSSDAWHLWKLPIEGGEPVLVTDYFAVYPSASPDGRALPVWEEMNRKEKNTPVF
jgi:hypothetical protein